MKWLVLGALLVLVAAGDVEDTEEEKRTKMQACLDLARIRLNLDGDEITEFLDNTLLDKKRAEEKITAHILLSCFNSIPLQMAIDFLESGKQSTEENLKYTEYDITSMMKPKDQADL